jgi:hypothetical protein
LLFTVQSHIANRLAPPALCCHQNKRLRRLA